MGGPENGNFPLFYVVKCPYVGGWVVRKSLKTPLRNIKMAPKLYISELLANDVLLVSIILLGYEEALLPEKIRDMYKSCQSNFGKRLSDFASFF